MPRGSTVDGASSKVVGKLYELLDVLAAVRMDLTSPVISDETIDLLRRLTDNAVVLAKEAIESIETPGPSSMPE